MSIGLYITKEIAETIIRTHLNVDAEELPIFWVDGTNMLTGVKEKDIPLYNWTGTWDLTQPNGSIIPVVLVRINDTDYYWISYTSDRGIERIQHSFDSNGNSDFGKLMNRRDVSFGG